MTRVPRKAVMLVAATTVNDQLTAGFRDSAPIPDPTHTTDTSPYRVLSGTFVPSSTRPLTLSVVIWSGRYDVAYGAAALN